MSRKFSLLLAACAVLIFAGVSQAQRLSSNVKPEHYTLKLTPDLKAATFHGEETIDVNLAAPSNAITLNAIEIKFGTVTLNGQTATVALNEKDQQATFTVPQQLPAGKVTIAITYDGMLNNELRGFYLSKTQKRNYAVTQFEATDARRAFPSFDEPAMKATYDVTLVIDAGDTGISNTNIISDQPGPMADKHTVKFATTPKMSTYLVAFLVGDFKCVSGESDGVPIRACATPDKYELGKYAVTVAEFTLHYYNQYFGIKYPMPKLDMIGIPDFEAGAMENFGAITYREEAFLINEKTASENEKKNVAETVTHEMAHQWFGDMVTMEWWNNLWLNEGFATWMSKKPLEAWKPEWNIPQDRAQELTGTLNYDSGKITRPIRSKADTPDEINQQFDGISYGKAGAVLAMVESYLGEETFRQGVHNYLAAHLYANATAEDFWNAQTANSKKPVDKIMEGFVSQPGVPLLTFAAPFGGKVGVSQKRFYLSRLVKDEKGQTWTIPVCFTAGAGAARCELLQPEKEQTVSAPKSPFLFANAGAHGYYRTQYTEADYKKLVAAVETKLTAPERVYMLGNQWALMRSGDGNVAQYLDLVAAISKDTNSAVISDALQSVGSVRGRIADTPEEREQLEAWVRRTFRPLYDEVKTPSASDTPDRKELRATLFGALGYAKDPEIVAEAKVLANQYLDQTATVDPTLAQSAVGVAVDNGDTAFYDKLQKLAETAPDPSIGTRSLYLLAQFKDPALQKRTLEYAVSGKVKNQDSSFLIFIELQIPESRELAWEFVQQNWDKVQAQLTTATGGGLVGSTGSFCDVKHRDEVTAFFASHKVAASDRSLPRAINAINDCIDLRGAQNPSLKEWLAVNAK
jgi:aminopeptidase N/puromycin-sensitive aminopeptidase